MQKVTKMILVRTINGKRVVYDIEPGGEIISKDGVPIKKQHKTFEEVRKKHLDKQREITGFRQ